MTIHLLRLCVGAESVDDLRRWQAGRLEGHAGRPVAVGATRRRPRRAEELCGGGSIYWVIKHSVVVRQRLVGLLDAEDEEGRPCCRILYDPDLVLTEPQPRRPFQGWRYLAPEDAPRDLSVADPGKDDTVPPDLARHLRDLGVV